MSRSARSRSSSSPASSPSPLRLADPRPLRIRARRRGAVRGHRRRSRSLPPPPQRHSASSPRGASPPTPAPRSWSRARSPAAIVSLEVAEKQRVRKGQRIAELRSRRPARRARRGPAPGSSRARPRSAWPRRSATAPRASTTRRSIPPRGATGRCATSRSRRRGARPRSLPTTRLEAEIAKRRIVAPIDGVVLVRHVDCRGESIEARAGIVTIADLAQVRIEAEVDEFDSGRLVAGSRPSRSPPKASTAPLARHGGGDSGQRPGPPAEAAGPGQARRHPGPAGEDPPRRTDAAQAGSAGRGRDRRLSKPSNSTAVELQAAYRVATRQLSSCFDHHYLTRLRTCSAGSSACRAGRRTRRRSRGGSPSAP
jgi:hypothetical protein